MLCNTSSNEIPVHDLEIQFGNLNLVLEGVVVADVACAQSLVCLRARLEDLFVQERDANFPWEAVGCGF